MIKEEFLKTFKIVPTCCKYAQYGYEGEEGTWYYCIKENKECWTYPTGIAGCVEKDIEITDRNILQLICILNDITFPSIDGCTVEELFNNVLKECIDAITKVNWRNRNISVDDYIKRVQEVFR